ncbi:glycoside hydrolase [Sphaerosporella brunnea]|uniref:alpha-1,2-Mannosidase n=1 Tax=Sphaerosporella brunnea TaxID=1250544 RepID=A0A5J5FAJ4_9PEZI|nr:glycoside hydrolase [Sphaerosporella brunnea]
MRFWHVLTLSTCALAAAFPPHQTRNIKRATSDEDRAAAIKEAFRHSWNGYKKFAWGHDELYPVSNRAGDSRNGWGASIADALSTACLMELDDVVLDALQHLAAVDFTKTSTPVSLFETTIRYLGGLLSGYDLLTGPYSHLVPSNQRNLVKALLSQAEVLADRLSFAFDTPSGIPYNNLNFFTNSSSDGSNVNGLATTGTLVLEWTRLSDLTGNEKYAKLAQKAEAYLLNPQPKNIAEPFPGMLGTNINIADGRFLDSSGGWSGGTDSFYEYLLKMSVYSPSRFGKYADRWITAVESTMKYLLQVSSTATFVAEYNNANSLRLQEGHLTCFIGGNFLLGGDRLNRPDIKAAGLKLTEGCRAAYTATPSKIGPERWSWDRSAVPVNYVTFFMYNGFYPIVNSYDLRPEVIESYYHAYTLTGDAIYKNWAWEAFAAIDKACRTSTGYSSITDVMSPDGGQKTDFQESFWFAEVLKYLYLSFAESPVGVNKGWVFNTEAHPLKIVG